MFISDKMTPHLEFGNTDSARFYRHLEAGTQGISPKVSSIIKQRFIPGQTREAFETEIRQWLKKKDVAILDTNPGFSFHAVQHKIATKQPQISFVCTGVTWTVRLHGNWSGPSTLNHDYIVNLTRCGGKVIDAWNLADLKREISGFSAFFKNLFGDGE
ncbi:MAG: hypothetical protein HQM12_10960 [SAR324 cluster bacterium]|nr:hypothetical protein [SAR324 cluster bacterium]